MAISNLREGPKANRREPNSLWIAKPPAQRYRPSNFFGNVPAAFGRAGNDCKASANAAATHALSAARKLLTKRIGFGENTKAMNPLSQRPTEPNSKTDKDWPNPYLKKALALDKAMSRSKLSVGLDNKTSSRSNPKRIRTVQMVSRSGGYNSFIERPVRIHSRRG